MMDFQDIKNLFPEDQWDVGILSGDNYYECINSPIKLPTHQYGHSINDPIRTGPKYIETLEEITSFLILIKRTEDANNYSLYEESRKILEKKYECDPVYFNFKKAAILSGLGTVARNSLVYNRKFGFQCKICAYSVEDGKFYNYPLPKINRGLLELCEGCDDCIVNCPSGAIHETWIDSKKCDAYIGLSNDENHISVKWFWWENCGKYQGKYTEDQIRNWSTTEEFNIEWVHPFYRKDGILKKDGVAIDIPHCRECQKQPRCSKMPFIDQ
jgi:ferredoxin